MLKKCLHLSPHGVSMLNVIELTIIKVAWFQATLVFAQRRGKRPQGGKMSKRETIEQKTTELLAPIVSDKGVEIYDVEYVSEAGEWYLRAYIDKPGGVTIDDCEAVSRALSDALDADDFIEDAYYLEVSSPGLGRTLKKDSHLEKSIGMEVDVKTYKPIDKQKEFTGILKGFDADKITLEIAGEEVSFARKEIANIKLTLDF